MFYLLVPNHKDLDTLRSGPRVVLCNKILNHSSLIPFTRLSSPLYAKTFKKLFFFLVMIVFAIILSSYLFATVSWTQTVGTPYLTTDLSHTYPSHTQK